MRLRVRSKTKSKTCSLLIWRRLVTLQVQRTSNTPLSRQSSLSSLAKSALGGEPKSRRQKSPQFVRRAWSPSVPTPTKSTMLRACVSTATLNLAEKSEPSAALTNKSTPKTYAKIATWKNIQKVSASRIKKPKNWQMLSLREVKVLNWKSSEAGPTAKRA